MGACTGRSVLASLIEFRGLPPRGSGQDQSNLAAIIAMQQLETTDQPLIDETIRIIHALAELFPPEAQQASPVSIWLSHYTLFGSQRQKADSVAMSLSKYKYQLQSAELMIAARLAG